MQDHSVRRYLGVSGLELVSTLDWPMFIGDAIVWREFGLLEWRSS
jgi:hypothetical protein